MKIEIIVDPAKPGGALAQRVAPAPVAAPTAPAADSNGAQSNRPAGRGRRPARGRGGRAPKAERPAKSAADLDAEMEDYSKTTAPAS